MSADSLSGWSPPDDNSPGEVSEQLMARFPTATAALVFIAQSRSTEKIVVTQCLRSEESWWVETDLPFEVARDTVLGCGGLLHALLDGSLVPDRGWGGPPSAGTGLDPSEFRAVPIIDLVRAAGLSRMASSAVSSAVVLLPGGQLAPLVRRALDLRLNVTYQRVELAPLFGSGPARPAFAVTLEAPSVLPAYLIAALERDPFTLVCRQVSDQLLVQHRYESPLSDSALSALADGTWVMASDGHGCSRLTFGGRPQPGANLVRLAYDQPLEDPPVTDFWPDTVPEPPAVTVVQARAHGQKVDAILVSGAVLPALTPFLEGTSLADRAQFVQGRDHHLLTAPGGVLEDLPVGQPLYCLGPGQLYLPLGYRLKPLLPPSARHVLLPADNGRGIVLLPGGCLAFDLNRQVPVWELWAGPVPEIDLQVPSGVEHALQVLNAELTPADQGRRSSEPRPRRTPALSRRPFPFTGRTGARRPDPEDWRRQAYALELDGELVRAAELHVRNNQPLQAARLFERAAELDSDERSRG
jgi:FtsH ternary system domain X7